jgi:hypothetical protein
LRFFLEICSSAMDGHSPDRSSYYLLGGGA